MTDLESVGVAELKVSGNSCVMASFGLGSCVAVAMFDPLRKIGGLAHVMLPESRGRETEQNPGKFANTAVECLVDEMMRLGARRSGLRCKIVGGSQMFEIPDDRGGGPGRRGIPIRHIGARNIEAVKEALEALRIPVVAEDTGGNYGRTVKFDTSSGELEVSSIYHGKRVL